MVSFILSRWRRPARGLSTPVLPTGRLRRGRGSAFGPTLQPLAASAAAALRKKNEARPVGPAVAQRPGQVHVGRHRRRSDRGGMETRTARRVRFRLAIGAVDGHRHSAASRGPSPERVPPAGTGDPAAHRPRPGVDRPECYRRRRDFIEKQGKDAWGYAAYMCSSSACPESSPKCRRITDTRRRSRRRKCCRG